MTSLLFFDTETSGLPLYREPSSDPRQPHCVQLAYEAVDQTTLETVNTVSTIVDNGIVIPADTAAIHGISTEKARKFGCSPRVAFDAFIEAVANSSVVIGHNVDFDMRIMRIMAHRLNRVDIMEAAFDGKPTICTMKMAKPFTKCPLTPKQVSAGFSGFKNPRLEEAYRHFFGREMENAHNALADVIACREIYLHMTAMEAAA